MKLDLVPTIIDLVAKANPGRNHDNFIRRVHKLFEEIGEISEAMLGVTSTTNAKKKTWDDVREEAADVLIVAIDVALTKDKDEIDVQKQLSDFVCVWPREVCVGYDKLMWQIARNAANVGEYYEDYPNSTKQYVSELVRYSFGLIDFIFKNKENSDEMILKEINRKLAKWKRNRGRGKKKK